MQPNEENLDEAEVRLIAGLTAQLKLVKSAPFTLVRAEAEKLAQMQNALLVNLLLRVAELERLADGR